MSIEFVAGDLFANVFSAKAFAHGCNCQGSMGSGIATGFRERYPEMYERYRALCKAKPREFNLGDCWLWKPSKQTWVFNLGTQEGIWRTRASYEAMEVSLQKMRELATDEGVDSIAMPRIGVGYGGLSWKKVRAIVERIFDDWAGRLIVYETYIAREAESSNDRTHADKTRSHKTDRGVGAGKRTRKPAKAQGPLRFQFRALTIVCTDLARSKHFYENVLNAEPIPSDAGTTLWYRLGTVELTLLANAEEKSPAQFPAHAMPLLWLEVDSLKAAEEHFANHDVDIVDPGDGQFIMIADPDGLIIEVWQANH